MCVKVEKIKSKTCSKRSRYLQEEILSRTVSLAMIVSKPVNLYYRQQSHKAYFLYSSCSHDEPEEWSLALPYLRNKCREPRSRLAVDASLNVSFHRVEIVPVSCFVSSVQHLKDNKATLLKPCYFLRFLT